MGDHNETKKNIFDLGGLHIHIAEITTIITLALLPCGLGAQSIELRTIKSDYRRGRKFFPLPR